MQKYIDTIQDRSGNAIQGANVYVRKVGGALATIYSDNGVTQKNNPLLSDAVGTFNFYAEDGRYTLEVFYKGQRFGERSDILLEDPADESPANINGGTIKNAALQGVALDSTSVGADGESIPTNADLELVTKAVTAITEFDGTLSANPEWSAVPSHENSDLDTQVQAVLNRVEKLKEDQQQDDAEVLDAEAQWSDVPKLKGNHANAQAQALANRDALLKLSIDEMHTEVEELHTEVDAASEKFNKRITKASNAPNIIPVVTGNDENGIDRVLIGVLQNGDIVFQGSISRSVADSLYVGKQEAINNFLKKTDAELLYLSKQSASDTYLQKLDAELLYEPLNKKIPIATDGRTLNQWRRKFALVKNGVAGEKLRVMMIGDSWSELPTIPTALKTHIEQATGKTAYGCFAQANGTANLQWPGVSSSVSGTWTRQDASVNSDWPYGTGPDGQNWYSSEVGAKLTVSGVKGHSLRIYTRRNGGSFRYSIDGSAWTTVTQTESDKSLEITEISGLTDTVHQVVIEVLSGLVNYCGILNETSDPVQIIKVGNSGHTGYRMRDYIENVPDILQDIAPDIVLVTMGTNDYRNGVSTVATFVEGITKLINSIRSFSNTAGIVFIFPAKTNGVAQRPLLNYLAPAYDLAKQKNIEMLNLFDSWGEYIDGAGLWADSLHVNSNGATVIVGQFSQKFGA